MTRAWYPWQLFVRKWEVMVPVAIAIAAVIALSIWLEIALLRVPQPVFLHYTAELGVDALGSPHLALLLPGFILLVTVINFVLANMFMLSLRTISLVLLWSLVPLVAFACWFGILILRVNGA